MKKVYVYEPKAPCKDTSFEVASGKSSQNDQEEARENFA